MTDEHSAVRIEDYHYSDVQRFAAGEGIDTHDAVNWLVGIGLKKVTITDEPNCPKCGREMWYSDESRAYYCPEKCGWEYRPRNETKHEE